ncbi:MAG: acyl-CoA dehydrogenase [Bacillota bacterium]|nr:acyl-CoA dehydrogenase [Bacillota bacterium]
MSAKFSYKTRDARFILKEWLPIDQIFAYEKYRDYYHVEDIDNLLEQMRKITANIVAPTNDDGEEHHPRLENGRVVGPPSWSKVFKYYQENGWGTSNFDENTEGTMPQVVYCFLAEMICAASPAFVYYPALTTGAAKVIQHFGSDKLKSTFLPDMMNGNWQGCMCITEPAAGTDVGDSITKAYPTEEDGIYRIKGSKIFISAGDGDHADNFIYLTLARAEGAKLGTKGLSLFVVPRFWVNPDGSLEPNDVATTGIEQKIGIRGCPTVTLSYGDNDGCRGYVVGEGPDAEGNAQGMMQMFEMMNGKRIESGLTSTGITANEYWNVAEYCQDRIQGRPFNDPRGERIPIIEHTDIKRTLLLNKATTEACRALVSTAYFYLDMSELDPDPERRKWASNRAACLTPICKAYPSDEAWTLMCESIQAYGGYGFTEEYPAARAVRDSKINSIYEGTNYVQSMDLIGRKWMLAKGSSFNEMLTEIETSISQESGLHASLKDSFDKLERALKAYREIQMTVAGWAKEGHFDRVPAYSRRILTASGQLFGAYYLLQQAVIVCNQLENMDETHYDYYFYYGKVLSARFYSHNILPNVWAVAETLQEKDDCILEAPPQIFFF